MVAERQEWSWLARSFLVYAVAGAAATASVMEAFRRISSSTLLALPRCSHFENWTLLLCPRIFQFFLVWVLPVEHSVFDFSGTRALLGSTVDTCSSRIWKNLLIFYVAVNSNPEAFALHSCRMEKRARSMLLVAASLSEVRTLEVDTTSTSAPFLAVCSNFSMRLQHFSGPSTMMNSSSLRAHANSLPSDVVLDRVNNNKAYDSSVPFLLWCPFKSNPSGRLMADRASGVAWRRRQRRLRSWWRHEQQTAAAVLATGHSHSKVGATGTEDSHQHEYFELSSDGGRPTAGTRPASMLEPWPQGKMEQHGGIGCGLVQDLDAPVLQMVEQLPTVIQFFATHLLVVAELVIKVPKILPGRVPQRFVERRPPQKAEQLVEVPTIVSCSSLQGIVEQNADIPVPPGRGGRGGLQGLPRRRDATAFGGAEHVDMPVPGRWLACSP